MVLNIGLEGLEGRMRFNKMWELIPQVGKNEEQMSGGEQWSWISVVSPERG